MGLCFSSYPIEPYAQEQQQQRQQPQQKTYVVPSYQAPQQFQTYYVNPQQPVSQDPVNYASAPYPYHAAPPPPYPTQYYVVQQAPQQQQQQGSIFLPALAGAMIGSALGDAMFDD